MAQKFYAPKNALNCLTITTHPGTLTEWDIITNLVRMNLMEDGLSVEEAFEKMKQLPRKTLKILEEIATWELNSPEMQDYLTMKKIQLNHNLPLKPIKKEEALALLENIDLQTFMETELSTTEWD